MKRKKETFRYDLFYRKRWILFLLVFAVALIFTEKVMVREREAKLAAAQQHIAEEVLRFHILANSDSTRDQQLKMEIKELVLRWMEAHLPEGLDSGETRLWMRKHETEIKALCEKEVAERGYDYPVSVAVTTCYFPEKTYGDATFPEGNYEALRIEIGKGEGHNWWCMLYPNLCFLDAVHAVLPEKGKQELKRMLTEEEYELCMSGGKIKCRSYFWELCGK